MEVAPPGHHNILKLKFLSLSTNPRPLGTCSCKDSASRRSAPPLCQGDIDVNFKSIWGHKVTRHVELNIHFSTTSFYIYIFIYIYTLLFKKKKYDSYSRFMPLLPASISALYSSLVELQGSNHGRSGEGDITRQLTLMLPRKRAGCNNSLVNPFNGDAALKLKMWIFTDFHPVLLQVGVEMLYLLAILGGFWKLELIHR